MESNNRKFQYVYKIKTGCVIVWQNLKWNFSAEYILSSFLFALLHLLFNTEKNIDIVDGIVRNFFVKKDKN